MPHPCPCQPPPHLPCVCVCVCQGIHFCAILNNSIFIGPTKTYHPLLAHIPPVCAPLTPVTGHLALSAFPMPSPPASPCSSPLRISWAHAPVMPSLPGRGAQCQGGQRWGSQLGTQRGSNQRKSLAVPSSGLVAPSSKGGDFVLYFSGVLFPEPGSPVYHPETLIKNKPLAVFFSGLCLCVQSRVRGCLSSSHVASCAPPWVLLQAAPPCPWGRSGFCTLWLH